MRKSRFDAWALVLIGLILISVGLGLFHPGLGLMAAGAGLGLLGLLALDVGENK